VSAGAFMSSDSKVNGAARGRGKMKLRVTSSCQSTGHRRSPLRLTRQPSEPLNANATLLNVGAALSSAAERRVVCRSSTSVSPNLTMKGLAR
jgi:hypothetical protein